MRLKKYALPAVALSLCTTGCGPDVTGDWLASYTDYQDGPRIDWPYTYEYDGATYTSDLQMSIDEDLTGQIDLLYDYSGPNDTDSYTDSYAITVTEGGERDYEIEATELLLNMACAHTAGEFDCIDVDNETEILFVRERE